MALVTSFSREVCAQSRERRHSRELEGRDCPNFGISWDISRVPIPLAVPTRLALERKAEREKAVIETAAEAIKQAAHDVEKPNTKRIKWPDPDPHSISRRVIDPAAVERAAPIALMGVADRKIRKRLESTLELLRERGAFRIANVTLPTWRLQLDDLASKFPNFAPVVDHLRGCCAVTELEQHFIPIPPMLLNGPPGVGKSMFAEEVAKVLNTACVRVGFDTAQGNSATPMATSNSPTYGHPNSPPLSRT